ncbi:MAG TPA: D-aminoacylase [Chryseolinea sp.]|nr:D-aminoacylase [Chryseolinea sp.]
MVNFLTCLVKTRAIIRICCVFLFIFFHFACQKEKYDIIIRQATIYDGSGKAAFVGDVAISGDTIAAVGDLGGVVAQNDIDGKDLALAPGFIDTHSHHDRFLFDSPDALAVVNQGITTIIVGQDGGSSSPLKKYLDHLADSPVAVNVGSYSGHNTIRSLVMGNDFKRKATADEVHKMEALLQDDLEAGAFGLSTGLEYDPGIYSDKAEVLSLSKLLAPFNGRYISHLRSEDRYFWDALNEIITIGKVTGVPVQVSHFKLAMRSLWDKADSAISILNAARSNGVNITADIYPYPYWSSDIRVLFPERNFRDLKEAEFVLKEVTTPAGIVFSDFEPSPDYNGKSLEDIARMKNRSPEQMLIDLIGQLEDCDTKKKDCSGSIVATSMEEADIGKLMKWKYTNICSDGSSKGLHPRGFGAFTRVLANYVRDTHTLSLEEAINKMTFLSAENVGIERRGRITPGFFADIVLFDAGTVKDNAAITNPQSISSGIENVWVNGVEVFNNNGTTKRYPGRVILRAKQKTGL